MMSRPGVIDRDEAPATAIEDPEPVGKSAASTTVAHRGALSVVEVTVGELPTPSRDWPAAMRLVERAADIIRDYETKFVAIEQDARTFIQRVGEEQQRHTQRIASLEQQLGEAEKRAGETEAALKAAQLTNWELRIENRDHRKRLAEAEAELRTSSSYIRKVEDLLGGF